MSYQRNRTKIWLTVDAGTEAHYHTVDSTSNREDAARDCLWALKDRLTSEGLGAWTVEASSGKAGGASLVASTADNWITQEDLEWAVNDTSDRAWVVLKSPDRPGGSFYLVIDYWAADKYRAQFYFTKSLPNIAAPVVNARPAVTGDEWSHANTYIVYSSSMSTASLWWTIASRADDGSFVFAVAAPGAYVGERGQFWAAIYRFNLIANTKSWDTVGAVSLITTNKFEQSQVFSSLPFQTLHSDGSQVTLAPIYFTSFGRDLSPLIHTDPWTGNWFSLPVWLVATDSGKQCIRGSLVDTFWLSKAMADGMLLFSNEVVTGVKVGPFSCPVDEEVSFP